MILEHQPLPAPAVRGRCCLSTLPGTLSEVLLHNFLFCQKYLRQGCLLQAPPAPLVFDCLEFFFFAVVSKEFRLGRS